MDLTLNLSAIWKYTINMQYNFYLFWMFPGAARTPHVYVVCSSVAEREDTILYYLWPQ